MTTEAKPKRLWNVEVTFSYAAWAATAEEAEEFADDVGRDISDFAGDARATLAARQMYTLPDASWNGQENIYHHDGDHDITWEQAVAMDRIADPEAAARCDEHHAKMRKVREVTRTAAKEMFPEDFEPEGSR